MSKREDSKYRKQFNGGREDMLQNAATGIKYGAKSGWNYFQLERRDLVNRSDRDLLAIEREKRFDKKPDLKKIEELEKHINRREEEMQPYIESELANQKAYEEFYKTIDNISSRALATFAYGGAKSFSNPIEIVKNIALGKLKLGGAVANFALGLSLDTVDNLIMNKYEDKLIGKKREDDSKALLEAVGGAVVGNTINVAVDLTKGLGKKLVDPTDFLINKNSSNGVLKNILEEVGGVSYSSTDLYGDNIFKNGVLVPKVLKDAPLDLALKNNSMLKESVKQDLKLKGYDGIININAIIETTKRQEYGEPQFNYKKITEESIENYLNSISKLSTKIQQENKPKRKSNISIEDDATVAIKPLINNMQLNLEQIRARRARELFGVRGEKFGNELYIRTKDMNPADFISQVEGKGYLVDQAGDKSLANYMKNAIEEFAGMENGYSKADHSRKSFWLDKAYDKNLVMQDIRKAFEDGNLEYINMLGENVGREVELTKTEAEAVGLYFNSKKINKTIRKDAGSYDTFEKEFKNFKDKLYEKSKIEKKEEKKIINEEVNKLKEEYKRKINGIKQSQESIITEKTIARNEQADFRTKRDITLEEEHKNIINQKNKVNETYNTQLKNIISEKTNKIKEIKNKVNEIKKQRTTEINNIQNNNKLYDPDKLPLAKKIQKEKAKEIGDLKKEINKISSEYDKKISELKKKQEFEVKNINSREEKLRRIFSKETSKYLKMSKEEMGKIQKNTFNNIDKEIKNLKKEFEKKVKKLVKENQKNIYTSAYEKTGKINLKNYRDFYKNFKELQSEFPEITTLKELIESNGELVSTNTYSIQKNPLEVARALYYDINKTTKEAKKGDGVIEYSTPYSIGEKWGNKIKSDALISGDSLSTKEILDTGFENYKKIFEGREKNVWEIVNGVYQELAKRESGLERLEEFAGDMRVDKRKFSKDLSSVSKFKLQGLNSDVRSYAEKQISALKSTTGMYNNYKPNLWIDPKNQKLTSGMAKTATKGFLSFKFLGNLNAIKEFPTNEFRVVLGARQLGWNKKYSILKSSVLDPLKVNLDLVLNTRNITEDTIEKITNPIVKRRAEFFVERRVANDLVWNNPENFTTFYKASQYGEKALKTAGDTMATLQLVSDVHRVVNAEWATYNYLKDIFPDLKKIESIPVLKKVLDTNGIDGKTLSELQVRLKKLSDTELMEMVWSGKKAENIVDYRIQSLFEQFADIMGKEFNAFEKIEGNWASKKFPFTMDMLMLYKRYSLGAVDNFSRKLLTYYSDDGFIRKRLDYNGDFKANWKQTFKGMNTANFLDFSKAAIGVGLLTTGIMWTHGAISGSTEDEKAEAKLKAIFSDGDILPFIFESLESYVMDITGIGLLYGGNSVIGGFKDNAVARWKRAASAEKLSSEEAVTWWLVSTVGTPEFLSRGIDNIKLEKNIPTRLTTSSVDMQREWKYKYKRLAEIDQAKGKLPIEKAFGTAINWWKYYKKNPDLAYEITGSDKSMNKDVVIAGAVGITKLGEEFSEVASLQEVLKDERQEYKQQQLEILGLDIDTQLSKLSNSEKNTLNVILAFKKINEEEEILYLLQQLNRSADKASFLKSILEPEEMESFLTYKQNLINNRENVNKKLKKLEDKKGIDKYLKILRIIENYSR